MNGNVAAGRTAVIVAAESLRSYSGNHRVLLQLAKAGANLDHTNDEGVSALMLLAAAGNTAAISQLIDAGAALGRSKQQIKQAQERRANKKRSKAKEPKKNVVPQFHS